MLYWLAFGLSLVDRMQTLNSRVAVVLFVLIANAPVLGNCKEFVGVFDADGNRKCAVGQPDDIRLSTNTQPLNASDYAITIQNASFSISTITPPAKYSLVHPCCLVVTRSLNSVKASE